MHLNNKILHLRCLCKYSFLLTYLENKLERIKTRNKTKKECEFAVTLKKLGGNRSQAYINTMLRLNLYFYSKICKKSRTWVAVQLSESFSKSVCRKMSRALASIMRMNGFTPLITRPRKQERERETDSLSCCLFTLETILLFVFRRNDQASCIYFIA